MSDHTYIVVRAFRPARECAAHMAPNHAPLTRFTLCSLHPKRHVPAGKAPTPGWYQRYSAPPRILRKAMVIEERGTHFDPEIVDAFLACEQQFLDIRERYADQYLQAA